MALPTVSVVFNWKNEQNKSGRYSIHLRIIHDRSTKYFTVPVPKKVSTEDWSGKDDQWVKPTHEFYFEINEKIREKKNVVSDLIRKAYTFNKTLSLDTIIAHLKKKGDPNSFYRFMEEYMKSPPEKLHENTIKKYRSTLNHLQEFKKELYFSEIDSSFVQDFFKFLQVRQKLGGAACKKYMEAFKRVVRQARKENFIDPSQMEFLFDIKIKVAKAKRTFLDIAELKKWKAVSIPEHKAYLSRDRDIFLFQVYTGYYYKDLFQFTKNQLSEDEEYGYMIVGARDKNGNQTIIPIFKFPYAGTIIQRYKSTASDKTVFDLKHLIEEPAYNRNLKEIAKLAGITKPVSNKVARHTNAQLWVRYGAEGAILSKMLGHTKQETTKNYYDINIPEIVEGTRRVDFKGLGI